AAGQLLHLLFGMGLDLAPGVSERGDDEIFEHLDLLGVDERLVDFDRLDVALAVQGHGDHAAAGEAGHLDGIELGLDLGDLLLHRLRLLHQLADILHGISSSLPASSLSALSCCGRSAAKRSRTTAIVAPGKVSNAARTKGWLPMASRCSRSRRSC